MGGRRRRRNLPCPVWAQAAMNLLERELAYPFAERLPATDEAIDVAAGIRWVRLRLPFALDHVNAWLLRDAWGGRDGWTLVDCGIADAVTRAQWEGLLAHRLDGLPLLRVLCTHAHPDHLGNADWLCRRFDVPLWMTFGEYAFGQMLSQRARQPDDALARAHYTVHGLPADRVEAMVMRFHGYYTSMVPAIPGAFRRVLPGEIVEIGGRHWRAIIGRGHSAEHLSLLCESASESLLIAGDMVLPRISTNCSVFEGEPDADPLAWYLGSLHEYEACATETLVLPSHGRPFRGLHRRIEQLFAHHDERLGLLAQSLGKEPINAMRAMRLLFDRDFDLHQTAFAFGEALAHLNWLWHAGRAQRRIDADAKVVFSGC